MRVRPELLDQLAGRASVAALRARQVRAGAALLAATLVALLMVILWLGTRSDIALAWRAPVFWLKLGFPAVMGVVAWLALNRSLHPGSRVSGYLAGLVAVVAGLWCLAWAIGRDLSADEQRALFWGSTWLESLVYITIVTIPMLVAALYWSRGFGPLSPRLTGALAGLASGAFAAALYALHCREPGITFLGTWYVLGACIPAVIGMTIGPSVLRWPTSAIPAH